MTTDLDALAAQMFGLGKLSTEVYVNERERIFMITFLLDPIKLSVAKDKMLQLLLRLRSHTQFADFAGWTIRLAGDNKGGFTIITASFEHDRIKGIAYVKPELETIASEWSVGTLK